MCNVPRIYTLYCTKLWPQQWHEHSSSTLTPNTECLLVTSRQRSIINKQECEELLTEATSATPSSRFPYDRP